MRKKIGLMTLIAILIMSFTACGGGEQSTDGQTPEGSSGLEWPSQYMSTLPAPDSMISSIEKLNGTETIAEDDLTTQPSSVNVVMNEMTKEEAFAYYDKLKSAGFTINTDQKDDDQILLVGTLNDPDSNPFLFSYSAADQFGNVSITIMKAVSGGGAGDVGDNSPLEWPKELMGESLPAPKGTITSIDNGSTFFGEGAPAYITVVSLKDMSSADCENYAAELKKQGFVDDPTEQDANSKFLYSGSINSEGCGVTFQYDLEKASGFVSYNPMLTADFVEEWPAQMMGNIPDPGCMLISFETSGTDINAVYSVDFANLSVEAAAEYVTLLKNLGYAPETDAADDELIIFRGFDKNNGVAFNYSIIYENGIISYGKRDAFSDF